MAAPADAKLIVGSTTDPVESAELSQEADVTALDIVYDDTAGDFDLRISLAREPTISDHLFGTLKLGQRWNGNDCVTSSAPYDVAFANSWLFGSQGESTPWQPFGQLFLYQSSSFLSSPGVLTRTGSASWEGTTLRAVARSDAFVGDVYKARNYVCAGEFELFRVNQSRYFYGSGVDYVPDFALSAGTPPPPPSAPVTPGVIDLASPLVLDKTEYRPGEEMTGTAIWRNPGESPVDARHLVLSIRPAGVPGNEGYVGDFAPRIDNLTLAAHETIAHTSKFRVPVGVTPGNWVLWAVWKDSEDVWHGVATLPFNITGPQSQTPGTQPPGAPGGPSGAGGDDSAPLVVASVRRVTLRRALRRGLLVVTQMSRPGRVTIAAKLSRRQAALLRLPRTVGSGSASFGDDGTKTVRVRFSSEARRALRRLSRLRISLKIEATGVSGQQRVTNRTVTLRR